MKGKDTKPHIGIFGRRNNGKSSLINALANQEIAIVSDHAGTTTDPVKKSMEIPGIGPVILVDTAGIDDEGELGKKRVAATLNTLRTIDFAILVVADNIFGAHEHDLVAKFRDKEIPFLVVHNKSDLAAADETLQQRVLEQTGEKVLGFSALNRSGVGDLIRLIRDRMPESAYRSRSLLGDLLSYGDVVLLITPIDIEAPEGRMILPQVQAIRDILDNDCIAVVLKEREADAFIRKMNPLPKLVITDSQVFLKADASIPKEIPLTSFSIMLARHKGDFDTYVKGTPAIGTLKDGDKVLILESCTHHVSCDDIGRMKIPRWLTQYTGKKLHFEVVTGMSDLPADIRDYALVVQCGGCVLTRKQVFGRIRPAIEAGVPVTNYGMAIAWVHGIFHRAVAPFTGHAVSQEDYL
ncbi:MAG TPA: [FeFe] hydrogenase H-cluster maturation GTPase HydF [Bacteroidales bacterium]|nr:[FeFe] hydrogenase H-cluster maturation GTPase HydF [Bacteroidales bacterium]HRZ49386.1 [FeFe] hydrogenase H-cluster maturation GTPase HydF [Bacteroidales bacterium]